MESAVRGIRTHWRESGRGEPVLLVHGFPFDSRLWAEQLELLPERWRMIAPDLRGFGRTEGTPDDAYTMDLLADDMAALLDVLDIESAVVCGLSMGGYVAFRMWDRHSDRVRALVLCDTRAGADSDEARAARRDMATRAMREGARVAADALLPKLVSERTRRERPLVVQQVRQMILDTRPETIARAQEGMARRPDSTPLFPTIDVPTLVVVGADDELTPPSEAEVMVRGIPDARFAVIADAGHVSCLDDPAAFNRALVHFLEAIQGH